jgi:endonuclease/exonuclease/phosphatase family metal-dependent hydrolase
MKARKLVAATYNVHRCVGTDGRRDPQRVLAVLRELDADVIALQELHWQPSEVLHLLDDFAAQLNCTGIAGPTLAAHAGHYGNAVLTRLPALEVRKVDLSYPARECRGALDLTLACAPGTLRVIATHLGLGPGERRKQTKQILSLITPPAPPLGDAVVLMGDLNEWYLWGRPLRWLRIHFGRTPALASFPSRMPIFALDRIWVEPRTLRNGLHVHTSALARKASDHLPVKMTINWPR